jgi:peptide/nickel transport system substrate-binding protein
MPSAFEPSFKKATPPMIPPNLSWRTIVAPLLILLVAIGMAGCVSAQTVPPALVEVAPTPVPTPGGRGSQGTLRLFYWQSPTILNPHLSSQLRDWEASRIVYEPLASFDSEGNLIPILAERAPTLDNGDLATDGRSVIWRLKRDVRWSDGEPFTAEDVRFTYEYIMDASVGSSSASAYHAIERLEIVDSHTIRLTFKEVNPAWSLPFVGMRGMILPRHVFADYKGANASEAPTWSQLAPAPTT